MIDNSVSDDSRGNSIVHLKNRSELDAFIPGAKVALVEFYTDGCGICRSMEPVIGSLARELDIPIGTVNPRDDPPLIKQFDIRSIPLFVLFIDGSPAARLADGFVGGDELTAWIHRHIE